MLALLICGQAQSQVKIGTYTQADTTVDPTQLWLYKKNRFYFWDSECYSSERCRGKYYVRHDTLILQWWRIAIIRCPMQEAAWFHESARFIVVGNRLHYIKPANASRFPAFKDFIFYSNKTPSYPKTARHKSEFLRDIDASE